MISLQPQRALRVWTMRTTLMFLGWLLACGAASAAPWGSGDKVSGLYVADEGVRVLMMDLVQTEDRHVTGRYEELWIEKGKLVRQDASVSGAVSDTSFVGEVRLIIGIPFSATLRGNDIVLRSSSVNATFRKTDQAGFDASLAQLQRTARGIADAQHRQEAQKAETQSLTQLELLNQQLAHVSADARAFIDHAAQERASYPRKTQQLQLLLDKEKTISGAAGAAQAARRSVVVQMQGLGMAETDLHTQVVSSSARLHEATSALRQRAEGYGPRCSGLPATLLSPALLPRWKAACAGLATALADLESAAKGASDASAQLAQAWNDHRLVQRQLLRQADEAAAGGAAISANH